MRRLSHLFESNKAWAARIRQQDPEFFANLSQQQYPKYLRIGCSDSRVPANQIVGLLPGELFVHRNVANLVVHTDLNCLSVMQFAVDILKVGHIIVCGHYGCSGVQAALRQTRLGLSDNWLRHLQDIRQKHEKILASIADDMGAVNRLCEDRSLVAGSWCGLGAWRRARFCRVVSSHITSGRQRRSPSCFEAVSRNKGTRPREAERMF